MQVIDFFSAEWHSEQTDKKLFYLFDEGDGDCARLSADERYRSTSVNVNNPSAKDIMFLPIDHNLNIKKDGTKELDSTCDYLLNVNGNELIIFGEIKTGRKGWASDGMRQVSHTIKIFRTYHDLCKWAQCRAYVSNWRKWRSRSSTRSIEEIFRAETGGLRLYIKNDVNIDGEFDCSA